MILAFDTTLGFCSVALVEGGKVLGFELDEITKGHAEALMPMIDRVLSKAGVDLSNIDVLGLTIGPGSFTGVRVGISAAKGLAYALNIPVKTMTTLAAMTLKPICEGALNKGEEIVALIDARRGQIYAQKFSIGDPKTPPISTEDPIILTPEGLGAWVGRTPKFIISSTNLMLDELLDGHGRASDVLNPDAKFMGLILENQTQAHDGFQITPLYLREPDAIKMKPQLGLDI